MENVLPIQETEQLGKNLKQQGKKIVLVGGCFDLLHLGHITLLEQAKNQGDVLVVILESDGKIRQLKGSNRPLHLQDQRAHMLISLRSVDYVVLLPDTIEDNDYDNIVKQLQPAIIATTKGSESLQYIKKQAKENNAKVFLVDKIPNLSTSRIVGIITKEL